jgi:RNA polymerase sigma-70 factor (ECF subfamily)
MSQPVHPRSEKARPKRRVVRNTIRGQILRAAAKAADRPQEARPLLSKSSPKPQACFKSLYEYHFQELWALAYAITRNAATASEIVQEAFLRLLIQWQIGREIRNPRAWLLRVSRNLARDDAKSAYRRTTTSEPDLMADFVPSRDESPHAVAEREERCQEVRRAVARLPRPLRRIYRLYYEQGLTVRQVAGRIRKPSSVVGRALLTILLRLQPLLKHLRPDAVEADVVVIS